MTASDQLAQLHSEYREATERVRKMESSLTPEAWHHSNGGWSALQCIEHLNITTRSFLPKLNAAISSAKGKTGGRYRLDLFGWMLAKTLGSRKKYSKSKTPRTFVPSESLDIPATLTEFYRLQSEIEHCIDASQGRAIDKVKVQSSFNEKLSYSVYSAFRVLAVHEFRHLDQAQAAAT